MPTKKKLGSIDKLQLVLPKQILSPSIIEAAEDRLKVRSGVKQAGHKSTGYKKQYVMKCPSGSTIAFGLHAADPRMHFAMKITCNPNNMTEADAKTFRVCLRVMFQAHSQSIFKSMRVLRVDQAYDFPVSTDNLIVVQDGSPVEEKYFVSTDSKGHIQTWYCGSVQSKTRFAMYDQIASDEFKLEHGELPSRPKARDDAEVVFEHSRNENSTRIEARRVFNPPLPITEIDAKKNPLGDFKVFLISSEAPLSQDPGFHFYLDSVRLRGIVGARKHIKEAMDARKVPKCVGEYEGLLNKNMAPWWEQSGLNASVKIGLKNSASWNELFKYLFGK